MKTILKSLTPVIVIVLLTIVDIPLLPVELVPEAQAIFGVRRRTAVVAYSAGAASANAKASSSQQQVAPAPQPAAAQPVSAIPVGTIEEKLPAECVAVTVGNVKYQECSGVFYRTAFQGNNLVYVVVDKPL